MQIWSLREERTWNRKFYPSVAGVTLCKLSKLSVFKINTKSYHLESESSFQRKMDLVTKLNLSFISPRAKNPKISPFTTTRHRSGSLAHRQHFQDSGRVKSTHYARSRVRGWATQWRNILEFLFRLCTALIPKQRSWGFCLPAPPPSLCPPQSRVPSQPHLLTRWLGAQPAPQNPFSSRRPRPMVLVPGAHK